MSEPFLAEIRIFAGNFAPRSWAFCDGQLMPIAQYTALFSLVGTTYGGDGRSTFALPNLEGRAPMHPGTGPGLSPRRLGQVVGGDTETLELNEMPAHSHAYNATNIPGDGTAPDATSINSRAIGATPYATSGNDAQMSPAALSSVGGGQPHENRQPYLAIYYVIALQGLYPSRS